MTSKSETREPGTMGAHARRVLVTVGITALVVIVLLILWFAADVFLLIFAGVLMAVFLRGLADFLGRRTGLSEGWSLAAVVFGLIALIVGGFLVAAPSVAQQADKLWETIPQSLERLQAQIMQYPWGKRVLSEIPTPEELMSGKSSAFTRIAGVFSSTIGAIGSFLIILFVGIYLAAQPRLYTRGILSLFPKRKRPRVAEVLDATGHTLLWWIFGKILGMVVVGTLATIGLWIIGVPLALILGLIAAVLEFIPNIGPVLAAVPAILLALANEPEKAIYVVFLYLGLQAVESYLLTPMVERRTVSLPPALTITTQILFGVLLGGLGLALATPIAAVVLVMVRKLYIEDILGEKVPEPHE